MDILNSRYFKINEVLLKAIGAWPYPPTRYITFRRICVIITIIFALTTMVRIINVMAKVYKANGDLDVMLEVFPFAFMAQGCMFKYINNCYSNSKKMVELLESLKRDWQVNRSKEEIDILYHYAGRGRLFTVLYAVSLFSAVIIYSLMSMVPVILDAIAPLNESRPRVYNYVADYLVDEETYYPYIMMHMYIGSMVAQTILVSVDSTFMVYVQHACGLFAVAGYRIVHAGGRQDPKGAFTLKEEDVHYRNLIHGIQAHQRALEYVSLLESAYSGSYLFQIGIVIICLSLTLVQLQVRILSNRIKETGRIAQFFFGQAVHLFCITYPGQDLYNHSVEFSNEAYSMLWYNVSTKTNKLLLFVLRRSGKPSILTAGGLYTLLLENFAMVAQTSMSYFTVLSSVGK